MSQEPPRQLGVTLPISTAQPTESELKLTEDLLQTLKDFGLFESEQEAQKRFVIAARPQCLQAELALTLFGSTKV